LEEGIATDFGDGIDAFGEEGDVVGD